MEMDSPNKIFVVGVGRSGTSLLQAMLASHPKVEFLPETSFFRRMVVDNELQNLPVDEIPGFLASDSRISRLNFDFNAIDYSGLDSLWPERDLYEKIFSRIQGVSYAGDKDPRCVELIEIILSIWKTARVIHIYRDPRDVIASKKKADWSKRRSTLFNLIAAVAQFDLATKATRKFGKEKIATIKYESLITDPENTLKELCSWLDLAFDQGMLQFGEAASNLVASDEMQWKSKTLGPLLRQNQNKWVTELDGVEALACEVACRQAMKEGAYKKTSTVVSSNLVSRLLSMFVGQTARIIAKVYVWKRTRQSRSLLRAKIEIDKSN